MKKINPLVRWWVTPKLPSHDVFELPLLQDKSTKAKYLHLFSQWFIHPIKRRLARFYLSILKQFTDIVVIGITGSAGKSTTAQILSSILGRTARTISTLPGKDSVYNIPNTILKTPWGTKYLVLEMSVEYPGEMDYYLWLAKPDIGLITNILPTHLKFLKTTEGVLKEKGKLIKNLDKNGIAFLNSKDEFLRKLSRNLKMKTIWFDSDEDILVQNFLAASSVAKHLGVSEKNIKLGVKNYQSLPHRMKIINLKNGAVILDDSYSSNPEAAISTLWYFNKIAGRNRKIAVLGDMLELGDREEELHRKVGAKFARANFEVIIGVGQSVRFLISELNLLNRKTKTILVKNPEEAIFITGSLLTKGTYLLIKGSRSIGLDKLVDALV